MVKIAPVRQAIDGKRKDASEKPEKTLVSCRNAVNAHVWAQDFRDQNRPIGLLEVFHNCNPSPANSKSGAIQCVHEIALAAFRLEADASAPRLKRFAVRTG